MQPVIDSYDRIDPFRPAAFRWSRAHRLFVLGNVLDPRRDDPLTALVFDYLRTIGDTNHPPKCPAPRFRLLHRAHGMYTENGEPRWELEARLLAGQSDREIASRTGLSRGLVALFHDVFCTCRDRLRASDCVLFMFIGRGPIDGFAPGDLGGVWKWTGYFGGPHALDGVIAATSKRPRRHAFAEATLESARRFVLAAQIPATVRLSSAAALVGMVGENEQQAAPAEATVGTSRVKTESDVPTRWPRRRKLGKSVPCGATS